MKRYNHVKVFLTCALALGVAGCVKGDAPSLKNQCCLDAQADTKLSIEVVARGLNSPWGMAFLDDNTLLVTERSGSLRLIQDGIVSAPIAGLPDVAYTGQGGLLDIALDPDFSDNRMIYLSYAEPGARGNEQGTAVARGEINLSTLSVENLDVIFSSNIKSSGGRHFGSRLRFAPDKTLFITLGDRGDQPRAQDTLDHAGSIIRIKSDGSVPKDNPFVDNPNVLPEIWSIGHRNPQGAAIHPDTGELWTQSHGPAGGDEVNQPQAGKNYGWPLISYGRNYIGTGFEKGSAAEGFEQPVYYWDPSIAPSGMDFYDPPNPLIPSWKGSLLIGALKFQHLSRLTLEGKLVVAEERYLQEVLGRIRDVRTGPDGAVWLLTDSQRGQLVRLTEAK